MHFKAFLGLTLAALSAAQYSSPSRHGFARRDVQTLVTIKSALKAGLAGLKEVDGPIKAITAANAKDQLKTINTALLKLSSDTSANIKKIRSSGTIGIGEIMGLLGEAGRNELIGIISNLFGGLNDTLTDVMAKRDIIKNTGAVDSVVPGIKSTRQALVDIVAVVPSQVPGIAKGIINGVIAQVIAATPPPAGAAPAAAPAEPAPKGKGGKGAKGAAPGGAVTIDNIITPQMLESIGKTIDGLLDQGIAVLKGTQETINLPPGLSRPPKGAAPPKASAPGGAAPPPAKAPGGAAPPPAKVPSMLRV